MKMDRAGDRERERERERMREIAMIPATIGEEGFLHYVYGQQCREVRSSQQRRGPLLLLCPTRLTIDHTLILRLIQYKYRETSCSTFDLCKRKVDSS